MNRMYNPRLTLELMQGPSCFSCLKPIERGGDDAHVRTACGGRNVKLPEPRAALWRYVVRGVVDFIRGGDTLSSGTNRRMEMLNRTKYLIAVTVAGVAILAGGFCYQRMLTRPPEVKPITALSVKVEDGKLAAINIHNQEGEIVAVVLPDGSVKLLKGTPEDAASAFWAALSGYVKTCSKL